MTSSWNSHDGGATPNGPAGPADLVRVVLVLLGKEAALQQDARPQQQMKPPGDVQLEQMDGNTW